MEMLSVNRRKSKAPTVAFLWCLSFIFEFGICNGWSAPAISGIQGTVSDGGSVTVTGSGFGATGPTVVLFDDFEKGTNGNPISTTTNGASYGGWNSIADPPPRYSSSYAHSGSYSSKSDWSDNGGTEGARWVGISSLGGITQIYLSWWAFIPTGVNVPGTERGAGDPGGGPNWKIFWLYHNPWPASDFVATFLSNSLPSTGAWFVGMADDTNSPQRLDSGWNYDPSFIKGQWSRWEFYLVGSTANGKLEFWETNSTHSNYRLVNLSGVTMHSGETWDILHFPGYGRGDPHSQTYYDDIYVAVGNGARARVEIGNQSTYSSCTNIAVSTVTAWNDNQVSVTIRKGSFGQGQAAFLFVVDANGTVNTTGYPITVGNSINSQDPQVPRNLRIP
jgi:hypothetical protein